MHPESLYEIRNARQVAGEPRRRWFYSQEMDLIVWLEDGDAPAAFQLAYDKHRNERAIRWHSGQGYTHYRVADERLGARPGSALLMPDGRFDAQQVLRRFLVLSSAVPPSIANFVSARLSAYPRTRVRSISLEAGLAALLVLAAVAALVRFRRGSLRGENGD